DAQEVPDRVFDIVGVELLVALELLTTLIVLAQVVQRDAALPVAGKSIRSQFQEAVEVGQRLGEVTELELLAAAQVEHLGGAGVQLQSLVARTDRLCVLPE